MSQTIAAISTPPAPAGLGVIRLSGDEAVAVASRVFRPGRAGRDLAGLKGYTAAYGHVFDEEGDIDDCVALVFRAPHSYTGEDVVELSCHGGLYLLRRVLREGVDTVIVGSPNVGKSTLINWLAGCERSIVTPVAGTTRDVVEETVRLGDVVLRL